MKASKLGIWSIVGLEFAERPVLLVPRQPRLGKACFLFALVFFRVYAGIELQ